MKKHQNSKLKKAREIHELYMPPIANVFAPVWFCREWGVLRFMYLRYQAKNNWISVIWLLSPTPSAAHVHKKENHDVYSFHIVFHQLVYSG